MLLTILLSSYYLYGRDKTSHTITENPRSLQMAARLKLLSEPVLNILSLIPRYFPFPQPTSATRLPAGRSCKNSAIFGHGLWRVPLKCGAIFSYTSCTWSFSSFSASPSDLGTSDDGGTWHELLFTVCESHWDGNEQLHGVWRILRSVSDILVCLSNSVVPTSAPSFEELSSVLGPGSLACSPSLAILFDALLVLCTISYFRGVILKSYPVRKVC